MFLKFILKRKKVLVPHLQKLHTPCLVCAPTGVFSPRLGTLEAKHGVLGFYGRTLKRETPSYKHTDSGNGC